MDPREFTNRHRLPAAFETVLCETYLPLARQIEADWLASRPGTFVLGLCGAQGTGKSTLAAVLQEELADGYGRRVAVVSLDDFYLRADERALLAGRVHPLLRTRGVPGTHDVDLGCRVLRELQSLGRGERMALPRFDKRRDDRAPRAEWPVVEGPVDLVIFEGWCVGARPEPGDRLAMPANTLEETADPDGTWRTWANERLATDYPRLFAPLDALIFLQAPGIEAVRRWRTEQEHGLPGGARLSDAEVLRFVQHFERLTGHALRDMPSRADIVIELSEDHGVDRVTCRQRES